MFMGPLVWGWEGASTQLWWEYSCVGGWGVLRAGAPLPPAAATPSGHPHPRAWSSPTRLSTEGEADSWLGLIVRSG